MENNEIIFDKEKCLNLFSEFVIEFVPNILNKRPFKYDYPNDKAWEIIEMKYKEKDKALVKKIILEIISCTPFYGINSSVHFVAQDEKGFAYHVFIGNYQNIFNYTLFSKGLKIICPEEITLRLSKVYSIFCLAKEVEILTGNFYNLHAEDYKNKGNNEFKSENYKMAIIYFSKAIELDGSNEIYFSNRSNAYLKLNNFENSYFDADKAISLSKNGMNIKAFYRKAKALFEMEEYELSRQVLQKTLNSVDDQNLVVFKEMLLTIDNYLDNVIGKFSPKFFENVSLNNNFKEFANFISDKIEIRMSKGRGRGIFAKQKIEPGELIVVEKAFISINNEISIDNLKEKEILDLIMNSKLNQTRLEYLLDEKLTDINIYKHGVYFRENLAKKNYNLEKIEMNINTLIKRHSFQYNNKSSIFIINSFINNCCSPSTNIENYLSQKLMNTVVIQSKNHIEANEELLMNYEIGINNYEDRSYQLNLWGFKCNCDYCNYDKEYKIGENIFKFERQIMHLINENKIEEGITIFEKFIFFIINIDKKFVKSDVFNIIIILYENFLFRYANKDKLYDILTTFILDFFNYKDKGIFYHKIINFHASIYLKNNNHKKLLKDCQSYCCNFVKNLISLEYS